MNRPDNTHILSCYNIINFQKFLLYFKTVTSQNIWPGKCISSFFVSIYPYIFLFYTWFSLNKLSSSLVIHLKFIQKVRNHKKTGKIQFWSLTLFSFWNCFPCFADKYQFLQFLFNNLSSPLAIHLKFSKQCFLPQYIHRSNWIWLIFLLWFYSYAPD